MGDVNINITEKKKHPIWVFFVLAQRRGFAPLAARPDGQLSIVQFANKMVYSLGCVRQTILLLLNVSHPQILFCSRSRTKKHTPMGVLFCWRREEDLNLRYVSGVHTISNRAP